MREKTKVRGMHVLDGGSFLYDKGMMTYGRDLEKKVPVFIPYFAFDTAEGWVLYDSGWPIEAPPILEAMGWEPKIAEKNMAVEQLKEIGVSASDVSKIIISHLHADHVGGLRDFPDADLFVQKDEWAYAHNPNTFNAVAYFQFLFDLPEAKWNVLQGDRQIMPGLTAFMAAGHTPGLQALVVELPETGFHVLSADSAYLEENIAEDVPPGSCWDPVCAQYSVTRLKALAQVLDAEHWPGHDYGFFTGKARIHEAYR